MADNFVVLSSEPSVDLIGLDNLVDVQRTTVMALPAGVSFPVSVPSAGEIAGPTGELAAAMADAFNAAAGADGVVGMAVTQDVDAAGNLIDIVIVTVASTNGLITAEKTVPLAMFGRPSLVGGVGGLGFSSAGGGFGFDYVAPAGGGGGGAGGGGFDFAGFSGAVSGWRSDLDALANL
jgi:hypothetical protein